MKLTKESKIAVGNQTIAAFMGHHETIKIQSDLSFTKEKMKEWNYHSSWSWLMPVVEKIEKIGENDKMYGTLVDICTTHVRIGKETICLKTTPMKKIDATYTCVVKFLMKYYNETN